MNKKYLSTMKKVSYLGICVLALMLGLGLGSCSKDEYHSRLEELIIKDVILIPKAVITPRSSVMRT